MSVATEGPPFQGESDAPMSSGLMIGLIMLGASVLLFLMAAPRQGEVVWFLRESDGLQTAYLMALIVLFVLGGAITISSWK